IPAEARPHRPTNDISLVRVVDAVAIHANDGVVTRTSDLNETFEVSGQHRVQRHVVVPIAAGKHAEEVARDAVVFSFQDDWNSRHTGDHVELCSRVGRAFSYT